MADIAQTEYANHPLALVDHRQSADLQLLHVLHGLGEVVVITAAMDAWCHHITRRRAECIEVVLRETFADDVSVGHHTDEVIVLSDWNSADIVLAHQFCQFGDRSSRANPPLSGVRPTATDTANKNAWSKLPAASSAAYR